MTPPPNPTAPKPTRWPFIRDVLVFQLKLALGNLQNLFIGPVSVIVAVFDLFSKPQTRQGENFYKVLEVSRQLDESINAYGAIGGYHATGPSEPPPGEGQGMAAGGEGWRGTTVDGVVRRVEEVIVREFGKGGTAASIKAAVDRVLDDIQRETGRK